MTVSPWKTKNAGRRLLRELFISKLLVDQFSFVVANHFRQVRSCGRCLLVHCRAQYFWCRKANRGRFGGGVFDGRSNLRQGLGSSIGSLSCHKPFLIFLYFDITRFEVSSSFQLRSFYFSQLRCIRKRLRFIHNYFMKPTYLLLLLPSCRPRYLQALSSFDP